MTNSWRVSGERLARRGLARWHYSNPFWRYGVALAFWYALVLWMGGVWALPVFVFLGLSCVFSMKLSNYFQHYGLRRVRLPNGRWEKALPRHSWSADWKFSNWMFFNMQRHADHHAMASRHYPLLQVLGPDESPELPGTYSDMMNIVLRPKRWFEKMDPLVEQWREQFYPEVDDWSAYDSRVTAARPDAFDAIVEIFAAAPRLAAWIERNPELLDVLHDREFTDLDLPKGFGPDPESEAIARKGLARLYWTREAGVKEMNDAVSEIPSADARETAEVVRNWSNDKAFQIGMHVVRGNLSPRETKVALSNLAEASLSTVVAAVVADVVDRVGARDAAGVAAIALNDIASRDVHPGVAMDVLLVHGGWRPRDGDRLSRRFLDSMRTLGRDSLLFSPIRGDSRCCAALPLGELAKCCRDLATGENPALARAKCIFEYGDLEIDRRFQETRREALSGWDGNGSLREPSTEPPGTGVSAYAGMRGGLVDVERAARFLQLAEQGADLGDPAPSAAALFAHRGTEPLAQAADMWRDLQGVSRLVGEEGFDVAAAGPKVKALVASACGYEDFEALSSAVDETAARAVAEIDTLVTGG